jgi:hypothetical protein
MLNNSTGSAKPFLKCVDQSDIENAFTAKLLYFDKKINPVVLYKFPAGWRAIYKVIFILIKNYETQNCVSNRRIIGRS